MKRLDTTPTLYPYPKAVQAVEALMASEAADGGDWTYIIEFPVGARYARVAAYDANGNFVAYF